MDSSFCRKCKFQTGKLHMRCPKFYYLTLHTHMKIRTCLPIVPTFTTLTALILSTSFKCRYKPFTLPLPGSTLTNYTLRVTNFFMAFLILCTYSTIFLIKTIGFELAILHAQHFSKCIPFLNKIFMGFCRIMKN